MSNRCQSRFVCVKSVLPSDLVRDFIMSKWPDCRLVYAHHAEPGKVPHTHYCISFDSVRDWSALRDWLQSPCRDPHSYSSPARSWVRSVRYLLHLDNPEKHRVDFSDLHSENYDADELSTLLGNRRAPILCDLASVRSLSPFRAYEELVVNRGHSPAEVSSAIRCLLDLERYRTFLNSTATDVCDFSSDLSDENHIFTKSLSDSLIEGL